MSLSLICTCDTLRNLKFLKDTDDRRDCPTEDEKHDDGDHCLQHIQLSARQFGAARWSLSRHLLIT